MRNMQFPFYEELKNPYVIGGIVFVVLFGIIVLFGFICWCCVKKCQTGEKDEDKEAIVNGTSSEKKTERNSSAVSNSYQLEQTKISRPAYTFDSYPTFATTSFININEQRKPIPEPESASEESEYEQESEPETEADLNDDPRVHNLHRMTKGQACGEVRKLYMHYYYEGERDFTVITGWGRHSKNGQPQIKPAVMNMLQQNKYDYEEHPDNRGRIIVYVN